MVIGKVELDVDRVIRGIVQGDGLAHCCAYLYKAEVEHIIRRICYNLRFRQVCFYWYFNILEDVRLYSQLSINLCLSLTA